MKTWIKTHPFKACILSFLVALIGAMWAIDTISREFLWIISAVGGILAPIIVYVDTKKLVLLAMIYCIVAPRTKAEEPAPAAIVAIAVIVVGGIVSCKMVKFCQRAFPTNPPNPPEDTNEVSSSPLMFMLTSDSDDDGAASYSTVGIPYCWEESWPADSDPECEDCQPSFNVPWPTPLTFNEYIEPEWASTNLGYIPTDVVGMNIWAKAVLPVTFTEPLKLVIYPPKLMDRDEQTGAITMLNGSEFNNVLRSHGITISSSGGGGAFYGKNGQPCNPEECPIEFIPDPSRPSSLPNIVIKSTGSVGRYHVAIQRSDDLIEWRTIFITTVPGNKMFHFQDITRKSKTVYRAKLMN